MKKNNPRSLPVVENLKSDELKNVYFCGQETGKAQAFKLVRLITEYMEWKSILGICESKETLKKKGFKSVDDYLQSNGLTRAHAYKRFKIVRALPEDDVYFCGQLGFTHKDLYAYASLPEDDRHAIHERISKADKSEIKDLIEHMLDKHKSELADQKKQFEKEAKNIQKALDFTATERDYYKEKLEEIGSMMPDNPNLDKAAKQMAMIESLFEKLTNALTGFVLEPDMVDDDDLHAVVTGFYSRMNDRFLRFIHRWEEYTGREITDR